MHYLLCQEYFIRPMESGPMIIYSSVLRITNMVHKMCAMYTFGALK